MVRANPEVEPKVTRNEPKGTWQHNYVPLDRAGRPLTRTSKTLGRLDEINEAEAVRRAKEFLRREQSKEWTVGRVIEEYRKRFLDVEDLSPATIHNYDWALAKVDASFHDVVFENLLKGEIEDFLRMLDITPPARGQVRGMLSRLWEFASDRGMVDPRLKNPARRAKIKDVTMQSMETVAIMPPTFERWRALLFPPLDLFALMMLGHQLRLSEGVALKWKDVNWATSEIFIRRALIRGVVRERTKSKGSTKKLEMDEILAKGLKAWFEMTKFKGPEDWIFPGQEWGKDGRQAGEKPIGVRTVAKYFTQAAKAIGLERGNTHMLRHSGCYWADMKRVPLRVRMTMMRHTKPQTTLRYGKNKELEEEASREAQKMVTRMAVGIEAEWREEEWRKQ